MKFSLSKTYDKNKSDAYYKKLRDSGSDIELKKVLKVRSVSQNAYLHVCIDLFGISYGLDRDSMKEKLKYWYKFYKVDEDGCTIYGRTSKMNSEQLTTFIEWIRNKAIIDMGYYILTSEEYIENKFLIDQEIESYKQFI